MRIGIVGAGNVASHFAGRFREKGHEIVAVAARSVDSACHLAEKVGAVALESASDMPRNLDLVIIATSDSAVREVSDALPLINGIVAHTSGSVPLGVISHRHRKAAVIYPLQTFSKDIPVDLSKVPVFVEGDAMDIARILSDNVHKADSEIRARLHIAGVMSSNFPIYLLEMTRRVLAEAGLPLSTVKPLVEASIAKAFDASPLDAITGPARRGDLSTVEKQSATFTNPQEKSIYDAISRAILSQFNHLPEK